MSLHLYFYKSFRPLRQRIRGLCAINFIVTVALTLLLFGAHDVATARAQVRSGVVTRVVDGDTVWVKVAARAQGATGGETLKVRIAGIDAPEICQVGGPEALQALRGHLLGQHVTLISPPFRSHDDYGRVLATVNKQGQDVGRWMVRHGQAWSYGYRRSSGPYATEQAQAQAAGAGLFAHAAAESPRGFRQRHGSCHP
jgi:micrococcal nuclease